MKIFNTLVFTALILFALMAASVVFTFSAIGAYHLEEKFVGDDSSPNHYLSTFATSLMTIFYNGGTVVFYFFMFLVWLFGFVAINPDIPEWPEKFRICLKNSNWIKR